MNIHKIDILIKSFKANFSLFFNIFFRKKKTLKVKKNLNKNSQIPIFKGNDHNFKRGFEMNELINEYSTVLAEEENLLDILTEKQKVLRKAITEKDWESLTGHINEVNLISDSFQKFDLRRDEIQDQLKTDELKPYFERLGRLRTKLLKCKVENQVISNYVNVTREFIAEVVEKALPQTRNKNYTKYGTITQTQPASVLVNVRG